MKLIGWLAPKGPAVWMARVVEHLDGRPADVQVRLAVSAGADGEAVWEAVRFRFQSELQRAGLAAVRLSRAPERPAPLSVMKKYRLALHEAEAPPVG